MTPWDQQAAKSADLYVANSNSVAERIARCYDRPAVVLHPPVTIDYLGDQEEVPGVAGGFWLSIARGRGYKNVENVAKAVQELGDDRLVIVGSDRRDVDERGITRLGVVSEGQLRWLYAHARGLVSVSHEDFGLTPIEANAFGTPVAVLRAGGFLDSTREGQSGQFIEDTSVAAIKAALKDFKEFDAEEVRSNAERFSVAQFARELRTLVFEVVNGKSFD